MVEKFGFETRKDADVVVFSLSGYLEDLGGSQLKAFVDKTLQDGISKVILDFRKIELISSPGVAAILDIASKIIDDFNGRIVVFGLDHHHLAVLEMSGLFFLAIQASDESTAMTAAKE